VFQAGCGPGSHTSIFSNTTLPASNNFWTKLQLNTKSDVFLSTNILLSLIKFFQPTYSSLYLKLPYRDIVAFRTKIEWVRSWSLTHCKLHVSRCDVKNIVRSFSMPLWCNKHLPGQSARIIVALEFLVFVSTRTPSVFGGKGKLCLFSKCSNILFFDLQVIFYGQMTSIINSTLF